MAATISSIVLVSAPSSFTVLSPFSSTYFSGSISSVNIFSKTSLATEPLITFLSTISISVARFLAEKLKSSASLSCSFISLMVSTISQLETFLGSAPRAMVSSNISAIFLELVIISISYSGMLNSSL